MPPRLPALGTIVADADRTMRRFPLVLLAAVTAATAAILSAQDLGPVALQVRLLATATLGLPLFTALEVAASRRAGSSARWLFGGAGVLVLATFYAGWPGWSDTIRMARYCQLSAAFHLMVAFLPFAGRAEPHAFWQYNRTLFERFVVSAIFSATLFLGLALALLALDKLFGVDIAEEAYARVWFLVAFVFNTWFFLTGVPAEPGALEERRDYPKVLKVFAQYLLVPIVSVYLVILTLYLAKVVVAWDWPSGWIGWMVSGVAVIGIFALLLVHPVAEDPGETWVAMFARGFWLALLPAVVMLWLAIGQRVQQYGITEQRYFLFVLSVWLAAVALYYGVTRSRILWYIPVSLGFLAIGTFGGPWGAYHVSEASQVRRLAGLLATHGLLADGRVQARQGAGLPFEDRREISAVLRYLSVTHGLRRVAPWFADSTAAAELAGTSDGGSERRVRAAARRLGIEYVSQWEPRREHGSIRYHARRPEAVMVTGYDVVMRLSGERIDSGYTAHVQIDGHGIEVRYDTTVVALLPLDSAVVALRAFHRGRPSEEVPDSLLRLEFERAGTRVLALIRDLNVRDSAGTFRVTSATGEVLLRLRP